MRPTPPVSCTRRQETLDDMTERHGRGVPRPDVRLRALPRPQVRPDPAERLLPAAGVLREHVARRRPLPLATRPSGGSTTQQQAMWEEKTKDDPRRDGDASSSRSAKSRMMGGIKTFEDEVQEAILMDPAKRDAVRADDVPHRSAAHHLRRRAAMRARCARSRATPARATRAEEAAGGVRFDQAGSRCRRRSS